MKIKSPFAHRKEVKPLCEAGADELFCGIEPYSWRKLYREFCINQRSRGANFTKFGDLEKAIAIAHKYRTKVHVTVNAFFYLEEQYEITERIVKDILEIGVDGIILADPVLPLRLNKNLLKDKDIVIGTDAAIFNNAAVKFYKRLGATRIVFPRAMTVTEMEEVVESDRSMEYEVFIIHDLCFFVDGFCTYCKEQSGEIKKEGRGKSKIYFFSASRLPIRGFGGGCRSRFQRQRRSVGSNRPRGKIKPFTFWMKKHIQGCGACAIYDLRNIGITNLKVLDRNLPAEEKVKATRFIGKCLDLLKNNNIAKADYIDKCKDSFKKIFKIRCSQYDCYYTNK